MKQLFSLAAITLLFLCPATLMTSCGGDGAANAENKDTISTSAEPQPDNATVRPDTMQTQVPQDSAMRKDSMK